MESLGRNNWRFSDMMMKEWRGTFVAVDVGIAVDNGPMVVDDGVEKHCWKPPSTTASFDGNDKAKEKSQGK
jgi:hypothetical protein